MLQDLAVGICRFSFLGRGDWSMFSCVPHGEEGAMFDDLASDLYAPGRMAFRMWCFRHILLPSIIAQTDGDFVFIILTSPELPSDISDEVRTLIADVPQIRLLVSDVRSVNDALLPELANISAETGRRLVQFRIDDDDGLGMDYVARLNHAARCMGKEAAYAFTMPRQLVVTRYADAPLRFYEMSLPFHSAGCAVRPFHDDRTVFSFGHLAIGRRFLHVQDPRSIGSIQLKFEGHDSRPFDRQRAGRERAQALETDAAYSLIRRTFPFLDGVDFEEGAGLSLAKL